MCSPWPYSACHCLHATNFLPFLHMQTTNILVIVMFLHLSFSFVFSFLLSRPILHQHFLFIDCFLSSFMFVTFLCFCICLFFPFLFLSSNQINRHHHPFNYHFIFVYVKNYLLCLFLFLFLFFPLSSFQPNTTPSSSFYLPRYPRLCSLSLAPLCLPRRIT